jgi:protein gp37
MSDGSLIEWTDATWNPVRGCTKVSPGCKHCYAETFAERWRGIPGHPYENGFDLRLVEEHIGDPLKWTKPRRIFVNSMSDLFHERVPFDFIEKVFRVMNVADWHTYQVLTKRPERMREFAKAAGKELVEHSHIWLGTSVEDQKYGMPRIPLLRGVPAGMRFLSIEPLLEDLGPINLKGIHWVIVGGESGLGARPLEKEWVVSIRNQCRTQGVPFFFKQWGGVRKKILGRELDGRTYDEFPMLPPQTAPSARERARRIGEVEQATGLSLVA